MPDSASSFEITLLLHKYQMFRGLSDGGGHDAEFYADDFRYNDNCFYGTIGIHGSGIYAHVNDGTHDKSNTQTTYKKSDAYKNARSYAGSSGSILECCLDPKAKVALVPDLKKEILSLVTFDKAAVDAKQPLMRSSLRLIPLMLPFRIRRMT